jgi:hypothetical protein
MIRSPLGRPAHHPFDHGLAADGRLAGDDRYFLISYFS